MAQPEYIALDGPDGAIILLPADRLTTPPEPPPQAEKTVRRRSADEKDTLLAEKLKLLAPIFGSLSDWANVSTPYTALMNDCRSLAAQPDVAEYVQAYLQQQPAVKSAADMLVTAIAMSANADWRQTPSVVRSTAARGWFLCRWLPTFLVVNGPITRFLGSAAFRAQTRHADTFKSARKFLCHDDKFRVVRNAFAHWSFGWEVANRESWIVLYDENIGTEKMRLHRREGDALHLVAYNIVDILSEALFRSSVA